MESTQHPQINLHYIINPHPQPANPDQPSKIQPHLECLVSSVALAVEATLKEHVYDTFDEALEKAVTVAPSSLSHHSPLLKWRLRVKERRGGIEKERGKKWTEAWHKRE